MDHEYIERNQIADRYLMGRLEPEEAARFEEHYLACESCVEQLELSEAFQGGVKRAAAEEVVKASAVVRLGLLARMARAARAPLVAPLALLLLALGATSGLLYRQLDIASGRSENLSRQLAAVRAPQANPLVLSLGAERSAGGAEPSVRFRLPESPGWVVLSLEIERFERERFRVELFDSKLAELWSNDALEPNHQGALTIALHSSFLEPGDYEVRVQGMTLAGDPISAGRYAFRVVSE